MILARSECPYRHVDGYHRAMPSADVIARIGSAQRDLTPAERRVAEVLADRPQLVAFGTVADLAAAAEVGAATVVRLAGKLGFDGFSALQAAVQAMMAHQLRPAHERIRSAAETDLDRQLQLEVENVQATLGGADPAILGEWAARAADLDRRVWVVSGEASAGVARQFTDDLAMLRPGVTLIEGSAVRVAAQVAQVAPGDVGVAIDVRRYDRWVVDAATGLGERDTWIVALTDRALSPLAGVAARTVLLSATGGGPFESHVGTLALCNAMVAGVATQLRAVATERLDRFEAAWQASGALVDDHD